MSYKSNKIYSHDIAMQIVELFENLLILHDLTIPAPEDEEAERNAPENDARLYGSVYSDLLDAVECILIDVLDNANVSYIPNVFSGNC